MNHGLKDHCDFGNERFLMVEGQGHFDLTKMYID